VKSANCTYMRKFGAYRCVAVERVAMCLIQFLLHAVWQLSVAASYWLVNKSGLPLIFKQHDCQTPAAGQFEEHEIARCVAPLLFCFADKEKSELYVLSTA